MHPGAVAVLLDTAGMYAAWAWCSARRPGATVCNSVILMSAGDVVAEAHVERRSAAFFSLSRYVLSPQGTWWPGNVNYRLLEGR